MRRRQMFALQSQAFPLPLVPAMPKRALPEWGADEQLVAAIQELRNQGHTVRAIAQMLPPERKVSYATVHRLAKRNIAA